MGRHGRPDVMGRARSRTFQAAAAVGVLGTLAFAYQSVPSDQAAHAKSDANSRVDEVPDTVDATDLEHADPAASDAPAGPGGSVDSGSGGAAPSASAPPRLVQDADTTRTGGRSSTADERSTSDGASVGKPSTGRHAKPLSDQPSADRPPATQDDTGGTPPADDEQSGPVSSTVETVGGVVDQVVGGIGGLAGGLTGGLLGG